MSLIDRYIAEVGRNLPEKDRSDIEAEIRSALEDVIEEKSQLAGKPVDDANIAAALQQFGDPEMLAQKYSQPKRYLIGTHWYEIYIGALKGVLVTALPISFLAIFFVKFAETQESFINVVLQSAGQILNIWVHIVFWMTISFVLLEHFGIKPSELEHLGVDPIEPDGREPHAWTPDQLPQLPRKRQIGIVDAMTDIVLLIGGIAFIAIFPWAMRIQINGDSIPLLHPDLWRVWLPIFFVIAGLTLIHELFKLKIGNWTRALMTTNVILSLASIIYIIALVTTQGVINPVFLAALNNGGVPAELHTTAVWTIYITVAVIIGIYVWNIYNSIVMSNRLTK